MEYIVGDLLEAPDKGEVDVIAHQCNCFHKMASGIAPQIAKKYPGAKAADDATMYADFQKLGGMSVWRGVDVTVYNLYGQYAPGRNTNYEALHSAMMEMAADLRAQGLMSVRIGFPKIGCGIGGGSWPVVENMIKQVFGDFCVKIYTLE